ENDIRNGFAIRELNTPLNEARTTLLPRERQAYIDAVNCLMSKPSRVAATDTSIAPGATIRFSDFAAVHINNTFTIHAAANFLS
ncbi:hypothetical protein F5882DRAFT_506715, partial [Hyaloscypha sp. PMI_1271]